MRNFRYNKLSAKSFIALVLLAVSFLMILSPWVNLKLEVMGRRYSLPDLLEMVCRYQGITSAQLDLELQSAINDFAAELTDEGILLNAAETTNSVQKLLDGGVSLWDAATICTFLNDSLQDILQVMNYSLSNMPVATQAMFLTFSQIHTTVNTVSAILWIVIALQGLVLIYAAHCLFTRRKSGIFIYALYVILLFAAVILAVSQLNDLLKTYTGDIAELIEDLLGYGFTLQSPKIFHLGSAPIISVLCALSAVLLVTVINPKAPSAVHLDKLTSWTCTCGSQNKLGNSYCCACGKKRPETPRCACGAKIVPNERFCGKCGKLIATIDESEIIPPA